jgi:hypothetical protein
MKTHLKNEMIDFGISKLPRLEYYFLNILPYDLSIEFWKRPDEKKFDLSICITKNNKPKNIVLINNDKINSFKRTIKMFFKSLNPMPCYVYVWGKDCDHSTMENITRYQTHWQGMKAIKNFRDSWEEGPCGASFATKKEYLESIEEYQYED